MSAELEASTSAALIGTQGQPWEQPAPSNLPRAAAALVEWARAASAANALAQSLCSTNFVPAIYRGKPGEATAAILAGAEVGLSPMAALAGFDMISGTAYPKAMTLRAVLQAQGHDIIIDVSTPTVAKGRAKRRGSTEWQHAEWSITRARQAGLIGKTIPAKDNWIKQPTAMLVARLTSELARMVAADALLGIAYSAEEMADSQGAAVAPVSSPKRAVSGRHPTPVASVDLPATHVAGEDDEQAAPDEPPLDGPERGSDQPLQMITAAQQKLLHVLYGQRRMDRDSQLTYASETVGRAIESSSELTVSEAGQVITALGGGRAGEADEPPLDDEPPPEH